MENFLGPHSELSAFDESCAVWGLSQGLRADHTLSNLVLHRY